MLPTKQRAELTFKHNVTNGRHGWLRLTPAYSVKVVTDLLDEAEPGRTVFDPFSGTGTTALCASERGHLAAATDINPFLIWFGNAKVATYSDRDQAKTKKVSHAIVNSVKAGRAPKAEAPPLFNIERWWSAPRLDFLCKLKGAIDEQEPNDGPVRNLVLVAFCRTMIGLSNAAFNHQSMSFKKAPKPSVSQFAFMDAKDCEECSAAFENDVAFVLGGASENPISAGSITLADARSVPVIFDRGIDLLITSPPYPNRMSYVRELRPYMYWLGYLKEAREAGELDWKAIGGTWGVATSRVADWQKKGATFFPVYLSDMLQQVTESNTKSGHVLSRYVGKYFEDMWEHIQSVLPRMKPGGELHYIVGNSKFYDVLFPVENVYRDMLMKAGASSVEIKALRKRNSKKELIEFDVIATV